VDDFEEFVRSRSSGLARVAYLLTGDTHLAEELLQDVLARVVDRWPAIVRGGDPEPYVRRVLYNRAVDGWRHRRRHVSLERLAHDPREELKALADDAEIVARRVALRDALARLTPRQRAVLILRFYEDYTEVRAAAVLGCSVNTVKSQIRHALERLRALAPELADTFDHGRTGA
jgi:RNA polymerase sigma-70 factor (sigma-E family)